jgi:hypothetical protein
VFVERTLTVDHAMVAAGQEGRVLWRRSEGIHEMDVSADSIR